MTDIFLSARVTIHLSGTPLFTATANSLR